MYPNVLEKDINAGMTNYKTKNQYRFCEVCHKLLAVQENKCTDFELQ